MAILCAVEHEVIKELRMIGLPSYSEMIGNISAYDIFVSVIKNIRVNDEYMVNKIS